MSNHKSDTRAPFPSREQIAEFIRSSQERTGKREIARAFRLDAEQKIALKQVLKELESDGVITRGRGRRFRPPGTLPPVAVLRITDVDTDGELRARPEHWQGPLPPPVVTIVPEKRSRSALGQGDRVVARLSLAADGSCIGRIIRRLTAAPSQVLGIYRPVGGQGRIKPVDRRAKEEYLVPAADTMAAEPGELVWAQVEAGRPLGLRQARIVERLGTGMGPKALSLITLHDHDIPMQFSGDALRQAKAAGPATMEDREDLRALPLVTIDGADARDFDDAVWAEADSDPANRGGFRAIVAIADVAWYVRPGDALDRAAVARGNSVYLPDRVVPMLPEELSNGWCSLMPDEDRPCLAVAMTIDADGIVRSSRFMRAMMRSRARLTYDQVQAARDGRPDEVCKPLLEPVIMPLYGAYEALARARAARGVLELDLPERRVVIGADGGVERVELRQRLDSHKLIEELMIAANVCAAETLEGRRQPCLYRVHDQPSADKLDALRQFLETVGLKLPRAQVVRAKDFNLILSRVAGRPEARVVNEVVLRSQAQAAYDPTNIGHFGLALRRYCHFTSPIRRYADLAVHRALIASLGLGAGGLVQDVPTLTRIGEHISATEQRAASAERDAIDRFTAAYLAERVGAVFTGRINGVTRFGLFVTLDDSGGDGLVPVRSLPEDYYVHDEIRHMLVGRRSGLAFRLGDQVEVRLAEADPVTGGLILQVLGSRPTSGSRILGSPGRQGRQPRGGRSARGRNDESNRRRRRQS
jgi:ribonuclease R